MPDALATSGRRVRPAGSVSSLPARPQSRVSERASEGGEREQACYNNSKGYFQPETRRDTRKEESLSP